MFVQATKSTRKGKTYVTHLVRESFRTAKGPRSRTICNISGLPEEVRQLIAAGLRGEPLVPVRDLKLTGAQDYGGLAVLDDAWRRFGLDRCLSGLGTPRQQGLLKAMILGRILFPSAKLALGEQAEGTALARFCGLPAAEAFDEDELYEAMDLLNGRWVPLEKNLYQEAFPQGVRLVLYDLTSTYFEGKGPDKLGRYGHSRDHRHDRKQVILAVATDAEGIPLHVEVLRGNRADNKTLQGLLVTLRRRFGIREATFVFDGGMSSTVNLAALDEAQLRFVTRLSNATMESLLAELPADQQLELGDRSQVVEVTHQGKRYVIAHCRSVPSSSWPKVFHARSGTWRSASPNAALSTALIANPMRPPGSCSRSGALSQSSSACSWQAESPRKYLWVIVAGNAAKASWAHVRGSCLAGTFPSRNSSASTRSSSAQTATIG